MKKIVLNLPDNYSDILSITAIGTLNNGNNFTTNTMTRAYNIKDVDTIIVEVDGVNDKIIKEND